MRTTIISGIIACVFGLLAPQILQAQGTTYLSNLDQSSAGSLAVGSDSWLGANFQTGTNAGGYVLDSVQLELADASGSPSGFTAMLYANGKLGGPTPGSSLGTLNGSLDPVAAGVYTYIPASTLTLSARTSYFIVLTAGTAVAGGAYEWSYAGSNAYDPSGGWFSDGVLCTSSNGSSWPSLTTSYLLFAISGSPVPEPSSLTFVGLGVFLLVWRHRKAKAIYEKKNH